jgi:DNA invertase Pin-like site-specific DNA recombinase
MNKIINFNRQSDLLRPVDMTIFAYIRPADNKIKTNDQRLTIQNFCENNNLIVDRWIETKSPSGKTGKARKNDSPFDSLQARDVLILSELSRLARSVGQIAVTIDKLLKQDIRIVSVQEGLDIKGCSDLQSKVAITMFNLFAKIESDLLSERTKEGLARAKAEGKTLGRPKGSLGPSKLDGHEEEIKKYLSLGVNTTNIARIFQVSRSTVTNFIKSRKLTELDS